MPTNYFLLLLCCLAVFRGAEFVSLDDGPWFAMKYLRGSCKAHPAWCELLTCFYCCSAYIAMIATAWCVYFGFVSAIQSPLWWAATWGGAAFIFRVVRERE